jgi:hypothetical protein
MPVAYHRDVAVMPDMGRVFLGWLRGTRAPQRQHGEINERLLRAAQIPVRPAAATASDATHRSLTTEVWQDREENTNVRRKLCPRSPATIS